MAGAAGILRGRRATTHWAAHHLLPYYGAIPVKSRVVIDGNYISTADVTAGLDGSLKVASILRGDAIAEQIQLEIEYAPEPPFNSGTPETASAEVMRVFFENYGAVRESRDAEARRFATKLRVAVNLRTDHNRHFRVNNGWKRCQARSSPDRQPHLRRGD